jgi:hypothetical protein
MFYARVFHFKVLFRQNVNVDKIDTRAFHRFGQAKLAYGGLILGSNQFSLLSQLPLK